MKRLTSAVLAALCLAGVAQAQVVVYYEDSRNFYTPQYAGYVASLGPIPTVMHNAPFPDAAIAGRIPMPGFIGRGSFTAASGPEILPYDRLVLAFNPGSGTTATAMCSQPQVAGGMGGTRTELVAVLCRGTYATSFAALAAPASGSPDDPWFRALLAQMSLAVFPPRRMDGDGCQRAGC